MTQAEKDARYAIILDLVKKFYHGKCEICGGICKTGKGFIIHHIVYIKNEKSFKDFETQDGIYGDKERLAYYEYLAPIVAKYPKRFTALCNTDHHHVTKFIRFGDDKFKKLVKLRNKTKKMMELIHKIKPD